MGGHCALWSFATWSRGSWCECLLPSGLVAARVVYLVNVTPTTQDPALVRRGGLCCV